MPETTTQRTARQRRERREIVGDLLTARQAAQLKGCSEKAVYEAINKKRLPADRVGPVWLVSRRAVEAWVLIGHRPAKPKRENALVRPQETEPDGEQHTD